MSACLKILSIDDDPEIRYALKAVFDFQHWQSFIACDVEEGVDQFRRFKPDIILIDYHLPRINGLEGVKILRQLSPTVPIIVFTIDGDQTIADRFIEAGATDFALKPIKAPDIIARIRLHIRLLEQQGKLSKERMYLSKGIGTSTLLLIENCMQHNEAMTVDMIAEKTGLAYQTTYRYIQYLLSEGRIEASQSYGKVGRPKQSFKLVAQDELKK